MRGGNHKIQPDHAELPAAVTGQAVRPDNTTLDVGLFPYIKCLGEPAMLASATHPARPAARQVRQQ